MNLQSRIYVMMVFLLTAACGPVALKNETLYLSDKGKEWLTEYPIGHHFVMMDNNQISQSFTKNWEANEFTPGDSYVAGIHTKSTKTESHWQEFRSSYGMDFSLSLSAGFGDGDLLSCSFGDVYFNCLLKNYALRHINLNYSTGSMSEEDGMKSTLEFIESLEIDGVNYQGILHFQLNDFQDVLIPFSVKDIYIAKRHGLVMYKLNNGIEYIRKQ